MLHELPSSAQEAIREQYADADAASTGPSRDGTTRQEVRAGAGGDDWPTDVQPRVSG
ncbi:hypothetical protein GSF26_22865 [Pseudonocardia alni]|nr:hypothetical protein [Pseudonocardia alni]